MYARPGQVLMDIGKCSMEMLSNYILDASFAAAPQIVGNGSFELSTEKLASF
jgi:hypothetical protein